MADRRIHIPKEHEELVNRLCNAENNDYNGPFKTKADVLAFAAAYAASKEEWSELKETVKDPIRFSVFESAGYDMLIKLLAVAHTNDPNVLSLNDEMEDKRASIFEGYLYRGLQLLKNEFLNQTNFTNYLLLITAPKQNLNTKVTQISNLI